MSKYTLILGISLAIFLIYEHKRLHPNIPNGPVNSLYSFSDNLDSMNISPIFIDNTSYFM